MKNEKIQYTTTTDRIDIETGEIIENLNIITTEYILIGKSEKYERINKNKINKRLILKYKHNGQSSLNF